MQLKLRGKGFIVWPAGPYVVTVAGRELTIGDVYAVQAGVHAEPAEPLTGEIAR